jgi:hypothetical protein
MVVLLPLCGCREFGEYPLDYNSLSDQVIGKGCTAYSECDDYKDKPPEYADAP